MQQHIISEPQMMMGKLLLVIMFVMVLVDVCGNSERKNNPCPDPDNPLTLQHPNTTVKGKVGDRVILPCSAKDKKNISHDQVEWLVKDPTTGEYKDVHFYHQGEEQLYKQRDDFKDRTSLFKDQLSSGNCSLSLLVTTSHSGTYYCCVAGHLCCTVTLKVRPENNPTRGPGNRNSVSGGQTQKVVHGVGIVSLPLIITLVVYCCCRE
ncbi:uncharacterized protein AB9X84_015828 [Acanthopagrus schlegelii]